MIRKVILSMMTILWLSACEKETYIDYYIDNQSSTVVRLYGTDIIHSTALDQSINVNEKKRITNWSKRGLQTELLEPASMFGSDLLIVNANGDTLKKDYTMISNWQSTVDDQRKTANHDYVLILTDADF